MAIVPTQNQKSISVFYDAFVSALAAMAAAIVNFFKSIVSYLSPLSPPHGAAYFFGSDGHSYTVGSPFNYQNHTLYFGGDGNLHMDRTEALKS